ncbi:MAG TPA: hypothetical protein VLX58_20955 [Bryobacteraceae bacterium]|nr:hypothetical protein [Bryobacteraceae bacterium]
MRLLTAGLVIKRSELLGEAGECCQDLASNLIVEKNDCTNWSGFLDWLQQLQPQVLLIDVEHFQGIVEDRVRQIKAASPKAMIIALHNAADPQMIIAGMRAGIAEYFYPPMKKNLRDLLERKIDEHTRDQFITNSDRRTIGFLSAKGGCGATTVACHTAVELGNRMHQSGNYHVLLADLDLTGGNVRFVMRSKTPGSVVDAMRTDHGLDLGLWNRLVSDGYPGLEVIAAPSSFYLDCLPEQRDVERVLNFARSRYQWTVLDLGCSLTPYVRNILESVNELYLVASPDVLSLYQAKQILKELQENNYPADRVRWLLNRSADYEDRMISEEAQGMIGMTAFFSLPNDRSGLAEAYTSGSLLSEASPLRHQLSALATKISGVEDPERAGGHKEPWYRKLRMGARQRTSALGELSNATLNV